MAKAAKKTSKTTSQTININLGLLYFVQNSEQDLKELEVYHQSNRFKRMLLAGQPEQLAELIKQKNHFELWNEETEFTSSDIDLWIAASSEMPWSPGKNIQNLQTCIESEADWFVAGKVVKDTNEKPGLSYYFQWLVHHKLNAFFSPSTHNHYHWQVNVLKPSALDRLTELCIPSSLDQLCNLLSQNVTKQDTVDIKANQYPNFKNLKVGSAKTGLKDIYQWFGPLALKQAKTAHWKEKVEALSRPVFVLFVALCFMVMPYLSKDYGMTWDEKLQYEYAEDIYKYLITFGSDTSIFDFQNKSALWQPMRYYGSSFDVLTVAVNDIFNIEKTYETRHFINALFGALGVLFAGLFAYSVTGSWLAAFLTSFFLLFTPSYFGHSMNNPKDVPFAATFFMAMYYMVRFLKQLPRPTFATCLMLCIGIGWSMSIRVGAILIYPYMLAFGGMVWLGLAKKQGLQAALNQLPRYFAYFALVLVGGWALGIAFWPYAHQAPILNPINALTGLSNVNYTVSYETFEGVRTYMSKVPWYYSLKWMLIGTPIIILLGAVLQLGVFASESETKRWRLGMLWFMLLFPVLYAAYKESMLYNGWRHWFFVHINLVAMAGWGFSWLIKQHQKWVSIGGLSILLAGMLPVFSWMWRSHPNQYVYFNELVGGLKGAYGEYETEYYSNSLKEAVEWFVANHDVKSKAIHFVTNNEPLTAQYYFNQHSDSITVEWTREYELGKKMADYAIFTSRTMAKNTLQNHYFPPPGVIYKVAVDGIPLCVIVKRENQHLPIAYQLQDQNLYDSSLYHLKKAIAYDPTNEEVYRMMGLAFLNLNQFDSTHYYLDKSIELLPENFIAYDIKGMAYVNAEAYEKSLTQFDLSIKNKINYTSAHYNRGIAAFNLGRYAEAATSFENAIKYGGHKADFYKLLGMSMINLNRLDEALSYLSAAARINGSDPEIFGNIGRVFEAKGDMTTADQYYQRAQQLANSR